MKSRAALVVVCGAAPLAAIAAAWLIAFASGTGMLVTRELLQLGDARGSTVTCRYIYAAGYYEQLNFTEKPDAAACARFVSVRSPALSADHWAAPLPSDRTVQIECRFIRYPADGDNGLGTRFTAQTPLRLNINVAARQLTLIGNEDQTALGKPIFDPTLMANNGANVWVEFLHGAVPILAGNPSGHLTLVITSGNGHAVLMLSPPHGSVLWSRDGGCRVSA